MSHTWMTFTTKQTCLDCVDERCEAKMMIQISKTNKPTGGLRSSSSDPMRSGGPSRRVAFETALCAPTVDSHDDGGGDTHADTATHGNDAREGERGVRVFTRSRARV